MGAVATFDYGAWVTLFPEFVYVSPGEASLYFDMATGIFRNDGTGPCTDTAHQGRILNCLAAHIAALFKRDELNQPVTTLVGRIASAAEGSVNVSAEMPDQPPDAAWFQQTKYGAMAWVLTRPYRRFRYRCFVTPVVNGSYPGWPTNWIN